MISGKNVIRRLPPPPALSLEASVAAVASSAKADIAVKIAIADIEKAAAAEAINFFSFIIISNLPHITAIQINTIDIIS